MSNWVVSLLFAVGVAAWTYAKLSRATGNSSPYNALGGAAIAGVLAFTVLFTLMKFILNF